MAKVAVVDDDYVDGQVGTLGQSFATRGHPLCHPNTRRTRQAKVAAVDYHSAAGKVTNHVVYGYKVQ